MKSEPLFRFVHCADLHLDSPFRGIRSLDPEIAGILREATFNSFENIVDFAVRNRADFLIIAGDVYNEEDRSLYAQLKLRDMLQKAADNNIQSFLCHGNHDPLSGWQADIKFPGAVHRFNHDQVEKITFRQGGEGLADIYGISYPVREVKQNLSLSFKRDADSLFSIGVLHCNVGGNKAHGNYAPCSVGDLVDAGMDYWALGHIHASRIIRPSKPCIIYPGCIQGLDILEEGAHGCYLVNVWDDGRVETVFQATDQVRWFIKKIDISNLNTEQDLNDALSQTCQEVRGEAGDRAALLRFRLTGRGPLHSRLQNHIDPERDLAAPLRENEDLKQAKIWVESVQVQTHPMIDIAARREAEDSVGDFLKASDELRKRDNSDEMIKELLRRQAPRFVAPYIDQLTAEDLQEIRDAAEGTGLDRMMAED